jgi:outer membrane beta-barrel protein
MTPAKILKWIGALILGLAVFGLQPRFANAATNVITFPEDELAAESVLPVFDDPSSVKSRNVVTEKRIEIGFSGGYALTEPFYNPLSYGLSASYHFTETHGFNLLGLMYAGGLSDYGKQLNPPPKSTNSVNLQYAPQPKYFILPSYQFTGYYGKLSFTKNYVMNTHLFGLLGLGMIGIGDVTKPLFSVGIGQKFYFNKSLALRVDLRMLLYQGPDVLSKSLATATSERPASEFDEKLQIGTLLQVGGSYLFPGL